MGEKGSGIDEDLSGRIAISATGPSGGLNHYFANSTTTEFVRA